MDVSVYTAVGEEEISGHLTRTKLDKEDEARQVATLFLQMWRLCEGSWAW